MRGCSNPWRGDYIQQINVAPWNERVRRQNVTVGFSPVPQISEIPKKDLGPDEAASDPESVQKEKEAEDASVLEGLSEEKTDGVGENSQEVVGEDSPIFTDVLQDDTRVSVKRRVADIETSKQSLETSSTDLRGSSSRRITPFSSSSDAKRENDSAETGAGEEKASRKACVFQVHFWRSFRRCLLEMSMLNFMR